MVQRSHELDYQVTDVVSPNLELHFRRDPVGNIDQLGVLGSFGFSPVEDYAYDDVYRLTSAQQVFTGGSRSFVYDLIGNRESKTTEVSTQLYTYAMDSHHLIEVDGEARAYDATGNLISDQSSGGRTFSYGDHNRLAAFSKPGLGVSYQYNGRGERVRKVGSNSNHRQSLGAMSYASYYFYDESGFLLAEHNAGLQGPVDSFEEYVYMDGLPVALIKSDGGVFYIHADHLGTPRAVSDRFGSKRWEWLLLGDPFGEQLPNEDPGNTLAATSHSTCAFRDSTMTRNPVCTTTTSETMSR